jgi:spermidine synthase
MALVPILQRMAPLRIVALSQPFVPALVFGCLGGWRLAFHDFDKVGDPELLAVAPTWALWSEYTDAIFLSPLIQIGLVLFVPVLLLGTGLPALIAAATRTSESLRAHSGSLVFWNTVGGSVGSFAGGYLLLPALGLTRTLLALGAVSLSLGLTAAWRESAERRSEGDGSRTAATRLVPAAILAALVAAFCLNAARTDVTEATITRYGQANPNAEMRLVDLVEGPLTTAYILEDAAGGKFIGSGDVILAGAQNATFSFQNLEGAIPALFYPRPGTPKRVLGIALGSGQSFGTLLLHPIEHMDVVDISTEIVSLSLAYFSSYQNGLGRDPRVAFHLDDGRHFIARQPAGSYDVVTTEPPPPTDEGVFALYSYEFCQEVDRVLRDGGVLINWLPLYRVTPGDVRAIVKTQAAVFPHTFLIRTAASDYGVVSFKTEEPPLFKKEWLRERIAHFSEERHMKTFRWPGTVYPLASLEGITALVMTGPEDVARMPEVPLNLEDRQQLSYTSGDRQLLRKFEEPRIIERLAFTALPITPFSELQRYFDYSLPVAELERDRVAPMAERFRAPDPGRIARQRARYESSALPAAKAEAAVAIAALHDLTLAKGPALEWLARALDHGASTKSQAGVARKIARHGAAVYASEVEAWIEALPEPQQRSPLVATMREELDAFRTWDRETRLDRYWFE